MTKISMPSLIEQQLNNREEIVDFIMMAEALASIGTTSDFGKSEEETIKEYFCALEFFLEKIHVLNADAIAVLLANKPEG